MKGWQISKYGGPEDKLPIAQQLMEENRAAGKLVVLNSHE